MKPLLTRALLAGGIALASSAGTALPAAAAAATSGSETVNGILVTSGVSGTRTAISSVAVAKGVFNGVGRIVEIPSLPGDPPNVSRDDLVYPEGTMHLVSTTVGVLVHRQPAQLPVPRDAPGRLANHRRHRAVRQCERHLHRHDQPPGAVAPATPTAAAPPRNHRCTRWTWSRSAERCRSDLVLTKSTGVVGSPVERGGSAENPFRQERRRSS